MLPSAGLGAAASSSAEWAERTSGAAAALATAAAFWSVLHPPSYEVLRALAAAIPVAAGFAETARSCALGRLAPGAQVGARARASSAAPEAGCRHLHPWGCAHCGAAIARKGAPSRVQCTGAQVCC